MERISMLKSVRGTRHINQLQGFIQAQEVKRIEEEMGTLEEGAGLIGRDRGLGREGHEGGVDPGVEVEVGVGLIIGIRGLDQGVDRFLEEVQDIEEVNFKNKYI